MRKIIVLVLLCMFFMTPVFADNQESNYPYPVDEIPPGMEVIAGGEDGGYQIIVPKGSKIKKVGAQIIVEGTKEYVARVIDELRMQLEEVQDELKALKDEIRQLKSNQPEK